MGPLKNLFAGLSLHGLTLGEPSSVMPGTMHLDDASSCHSRLDERVRRGSSGSAIQTPSVQEKKEEATETTSDHTRSSGMHQPEVLIIVQPSLKRRQHHPYNLQTQLLVNSEMQRRSANSSDSDEYENQRKKRPSLLRSGSGSSTQSDSSIHRRTIPLYNLDFHHIRTTCVLDAGTDQLVAKFSRRGLEITNFGFLEPHDTVTFQGTNVNMINSANTSPTRSDFPESVRSSMDNTLDTLPRSGSRASNEDLRGPKKFFSHLKHFGQQIRATPLHEERASHNRTIQSSNRNRSCSQSSHDSDALGRSDSYANGAMHVPQMMPGMGHAYNRVTASYIWEFKRFNRPAYVADPAKAMENESLQWVEPNSARAIAIYKAASDAVLTRIWQQFAPRGAAEESHPPAENIHVQIEWLREWNGLHEPLMSFEEQHHNGQLDPHLIENYATSHGPWETTDESASPTRSMRPTSRLSEANSDSSYAMWICFLTLDSSRRVPLARLVPAPHHPRMVCQLMLPSPLPDLRFSGLCADGNGFSREELRDIVSVTALFVVVREELGSLRQMKH